MSRQEITETVHDIIAGALNEQQDFGNEDSFFAIGINSVSIIQIQLELARAFKVKLSFRELSRYCSVEKLSEYLEQKLSASAEV